MSPPVETQAANDVPKPLACGAGMPTGQRTGVSQPQASVIGFAAPVPVQNPFASAAADAKAAILGHTNGLQNGEECKRSSVDSEWMGNDSDDVPRAGQRGSAIATSVTTALQELQRPSRCQAQLWRSCRRRSAARRTWA